MAEPEEHAYADSDVPWDEDELDEIESEFISTENAAAARAANERMTDALRFNGEQFIIASQYIARQLAKIRFSGFSEFSGFSSGVSKFSQFFSPRYSSLDRLPI